MKFNRSNPTVWWNGRWNTITGNTSSVFHLKLIDGQFKTVINWKLGGETTEYIAQNSAALDKAVDDAKRAMTGISGGSFQINEFGQVIVPSNGENDRRRMLVGEISGKMTFDHPTDRDRMLDLSDDDGLHCGDTWNRPYVGMQFNLKRYDDVIYLWQEGVDGGEARLPIRQDQELIHKLREIRGDGESVRFIVNPWGIVITKVKQNDNWKPVYVGRINLDNWFPREEN